MYLLIYIYIYTYIHIGTYAYVLLSAYYMPRVFRLENCVLSNEVISKQIKQTSK